MMSAAAMGATAFQKGLGAIHALSHPVGALYDTHHGMTNARVHALCARLQPPAIEPKIVRLAAYLGLGAGFDAFLHAVLDAAQASRRAARSSGLKVDGSKVETIADMAIVDPTAGGNPIPLTKEGSRKLFEAALKGDVSAAST